MSKEAMDAEVKLKALETSIKKAREQLELHGLLSSDHKITEKELRNRLSLLRAKVKAHSGGNADTHAKVSALGTTIDRWLTSIDLDFKPQS